LHREEDSISTRQDVQSIRQDLEAPQLIYEDHAMPKSLPNGPSEWQRASFVAPFNVNALIAMTAPAFAAVADFNGKLCESAAQFNTEWTDFMKRRMQEDFAVPQRLSECRSPQEAQQVWVDYWKKAFAQYQDEVTRMAKISESFARQTASAVQKHAEAMTQETRLAA
jgi:hypothetical protein